MSKLKRRSDCPINFAVEFFGDKWTLLIIRDMMFKGKHNYGEFLMSDEKIATNILADRLSLLDQWGIIVKNSDPQNGSKFIYKLTDKGIDLLPILVEVILWSSHYDIDTGTDVNFVRSVKLDKEKVIKEIGDRLKSELISE